MSTRPGAKRSFVRSLWLRNLARILRRFDASNSSWWGCGFRGRKVAYSYVCFCVVRCLGGRGSPIIGKGVERIADQFAVFVEVCWHACRTIALSPCAVRRGTLEDSIHGGTRRVCLVFLFSRIKQTPVVQYSMFSDTIFLKMMSIVYISVVEQLTTRRECVLLILA